jgi:periplasmic copper chaperone A
MRTHRRCLTVALVAGAAFAVAFPASAHVTVDAPGATRGGSDQMINVRVPTESDTASTIGLKLQLPTDTPIASVLVEPIAGWTFTETTSKLARPIVTDDGDITSAVTEIDWTAAAGQGIKPQEFQDFVLIAGQLPDMSSITFKAIQQYSDGTTVSWIETPAPGSNAEPEHPAPVLTLPVASAASTTKSSSSDTAPVILSIVALVVAAAALGLAVVTRARKT